MACPKRKDLFGVPWIFRPHETLPKRQCWENPSTQVDQLWKSSANGILVDPQGVPPGASRS